ncbi:membrane carboxypeptidase/penicillin-binding protein [Bradyrhizobium sp. LB1.3]
MRLLVRFMGFLFAAGTVLFLVGVGAVAGLIWHFSKDLPDYSQLQDYEPPVMTRVHATDGSLLGEYAKERRLYLPIQAVPKLVINAFLAAEDKNFYEHGGIDYTGMARAGVAYIQNYGSNRRPQGASTITQQVAKNFLLTNEVSFARKIKEALLAMRIEKTYSKDKILELYLNEIYLGLGAYGIAAASLVYFDKSVNELTVAEASYLAALPKMPATLHPVRNRDRAIERRNYVIDRLLENGWIKQARRRQGAQGAAGRHQSFQRCPHLRRRIFRRGSPPRHFRALRREEAVRGRPLCPHHARSKDSSHGAQDHGLRPREL